MLKGESGLRDSEGRKEADGACSVEGWGNWGREPLTSVSHWWSTAHRGVNSLACRWGKHTAGDGEVLRQKVAGACSNELPECWVLREQGQSRTSATLQLIRWECMRLLFKSPPQTEMRNINPITHAHSFSWICWILLVDKYCRHNAYCPMLYEKWPYAKMIFILQLKANNSILKPGDLCCSIFYQYS